MTRKLDLSACFKEAWRGFKGWWIPLCIVAALIVLLSQDRLLRFMFHDDLQRLQPLVTACEQFKHDILCGGVPSPERYMECTERVTDVLLQPNIQDAIHDLCLRMTYIPMGLMAVLGALQVVLIILSKASVQQVADTAVLKRDFSRIATLTASYSVLAVTKALAIMCCCVLPGIYLYGRLLCAEFIITEQSANPLSAITQSWRMTRADHLKVFLVALFAFALWTIAFVSIIGVIPARSFEYTLRAAVYRQLKET